MGTCPREHPLQVYRPVTQQLFHQGRNGTHQCLAFELLGPTVDAVVGDIHDDGDVLEPETILRVSKQLLEAITFVHEVGYARGGMVGCSYFIRPSRSWSKRQKTGSMRGLLYLVRICGVCRYRTPQRKKRPDELLKIGAQQPPVQILAL